jgi:raffinose/stachyose/melibiose transport system substrate-binding protein
MGGSELHRRISKLVASVGIAALTVAGAIGVAPANGQELKYWTLTFSSSAAADAFKQVISQFEKDNPGVTVSIAQRGTDEHKEALRVAANSDQAPDIFFSWAGLGLGGEFVKSGLAADMTKYYKQYDWDNLFLPSSLTFSTQYPGGTFGVPYTMNGEALYYNKALFEKAGITTPPTTWKELDDDAAKLKAAGIAPITFGGTVNWHVMRLLDAILETECGAEKHDALMNMKLDWSTEPCATAAFTEFHKWTSDYILKPFMGIDNNQSFKLFTAGRAAMMLEGDWLVNQLKDAKAEDKMGVFPIPTGTGRLYGFAQYNYISSKSKNPDIAAKFLNYLESTPVQQANLGAFGLISPNKNVKYTYTDPLEQAWVKIFGDAKGTYVNGDQAFPLAVTTEYWRIMNNVATDALDPSKAAGELQKFIAAHPNS